MKPQAEVRTALYQTLLRELIGPDSETEVLDESPTKRYSAGILFPRAQRSCELDDVGQDGEESEESDEQTSAWESDQESEEENESESCQKEPIEYDDSDHDEAVLLANTYFPSAMGLTFLLDGEHDSELIVQVRGAQYEPVDVPREKGRPRRSWRRIPLSIPSLSFSISSRNGGVDEKIAVGALAIRVVVRPRPDRTSLVTVALYNKHAVSGVSKAPSPRQCYYQVGFSVHAQGEEPIFLPYDSTERVAGDEEASLALLYRQRRQFAIGHGCASGWSSPVGGRVTELRSEVLPAVVVPPIEPTSVGGDALDMYFLANGAEDAVPAALRGLTSEYRAWIGRCGEDVPKVDVSLRPTATRHLERCKEALRRMEVGIGLLESNAFAFRAFQLANQAVLRQQYHAKLPNREIEDPWPGIPQDYKPKTASRGRWRTFQVAFILMNLAAFHADHPESDVNRRLVDLIWFPTGGGKTEAYLGLTAFAIFLRRLLRPTNGGCVVLMRYTLRLLTAQQFQRAAALICASDLLRAGDEKNLGTEPISLGLWVGKAASPNKRSNALKSLRDLARASHGHERRGDQALPRRENPFALLACPWCGTRLDRPSKLGYVSDGQTVVFRCPEPRCAFAGPKTIPVKVIDEDIYATAPTLVVGTVDKFAMLAWMPEASSLFGIGRSVDPPDLIIQDELHLISGPLGSMVGLYETAIEYLCTGRRGPKIIASTATIRRAEEQCWALYNRSAFQFPPPGICASDSFFAAENDKSDGRLYVGAFASAAPSPVTALVRTAAALHQGAKSVPIPDGGDERCRDPYWTQLQYFGSLRELGRAATLVEQDIPEYLQVIRRRHRRPVRQIHAPVELTSRLTAEQVPEILEDLKIPYQPEVNARDGRATAKRPIDVILATNMISVGVDIDRLGLMVVVGQPKTTSEYIQASSRVGRSAEAPGMVVVLYNAGKPRDRSHYERFRAYHDAFYRYVEPTSVTPFAIPVLERALHALLVIAARHVGNATTPRELRPTDRKFVEFIEFMKKRSRDVDPDHANEVAMRIEARIKEWQRFRPADYGNLVQTEGCLMIQASARKQDQDCPAWRTPTSMRNVDAECIARILQRAYAPEDEP